MLEEKMIDPQLQPSLGNEKENVKKGLLVEGIFNLDRTKIDMYQKFLRGDTPETQDPPCPASVHPNLWEQAKLNMNAGLYRVNNIERDPKGDEEASKNGEQFRVDRGDVFQVRGYDNSNMTLVYTGESWVVLDVLTMTNTAEAAWKLVQKHLKDEPISAVVYSHTHLDHYGGAAGIEKWLRKEKGKEGKIFAPEDFLEHTITESIYAGTAMFRRSIYQFGQILEPGIYGHICNGLGIGITRGEISFIAPTEEIRFSDYHVEEDGTKRKYAIRDVDGIKLWFQLTPATEAPAEMNVYLPEQKVLYAAENCNPTLHNTLAPRGAQVRDALAWAKYIDEAIVSFSDLEVVCIGHGWPHFGNQDSIRYMELQRDIYRYIHNTTMHLINKGYTINEVGRMMEYDKVMPMPKELKDEWTCHGYYGSINFNAKAVAQRYLGWYDGNPSNLNRNLPTVSAAKYVDYMGGVKAIMEKINDELEKAKQEHTTPDHAWIVEVLNHVMFADIKDDKSQAKTQLIESLRQLGYASESALWRNMYLAGAMELENPQALDRLKGMSPKVQDNIINTMTIETILEILGIAFNSTKAVNDPEQYIACFTVNITDAGHGEESNAWVKASRGVLHYRVGSIPKSEKPTFAISTTKLAFYRAFIDRELMEKKEENFNEIIFTIGNRSDGEKFLNYIERFTIDFPIVTP